MCKPWRCYKDFSIDEVSARDATSWPQYKQSELGRPKTKPRKRKSRMISNLLSAWYASGRANVTKKLNFKYKHSTMLLSYSFYRNKSENTKRIQIHCVRRENTALQCAVWPLVVVMIFRTSDSQAPLHPSPSTAVHFIESSQLLALCLRGCT